MSDVGSVPGLVAKMKTRRLAAEAEIASNIKAQVAPNGMAMVPIAGMTEIVRGKSDPNLTQAPEAFDSSTWSVIRRMIETIGVDEAIRRLMLAH
jgi:hypothetical protein